MVFYSVLWFNLHCLILLRLSPYNPTAPQHKVTHPILPLVWRPCHVASCRLPHHVFIYLFIFLPGHDSRLQSRPAAWLVILLHLLLQCPSWPNQAWVSPNARGDTGTNYQLPVASICVCVCVCVCVCLSLSYCKTKGGEAVGDRCEHESECNSPRFVWSAFKRRSGYVCMCQASVCMCERVYVCVRW